MRVAMVVLAFVLAALTYKFVEQPFRKRPIAHKNIALLLAAMASRYCRGGYLAKRWAFRSFRRWWGGWRALDNEHLTLAWQHDVRYHECHLQEPETDMQASECIEAARPLLLLWGDSHAASLYPGLARLQADKSFGIAQLTQSRVPTDSRRATSDFPP